MWFTKLMIQFFFWIDKIVYNFIPLIYDLLLDIARTSILTQADIANMAERIYKLLAIFMIFKVTLSLIMYVVNPDDFSDKSKGVAKLGTNIVISLALLILTPYIFNYAYQVQTIILEDNSLATLIFGEDTGEESFLNSAGDKMSYMTMSAFFSPNLSLGNLYECSNLYEIIEGEDGEKVKKFNQKCLGTEDTDGTLMAYTKENPNFSKTTLDNYVAGVEHSNLGLMFRQDMALATTSDGSELIMDYKFVFSTAVGVIIILLLITFCMDVAVRSLKLAFFQLIAPIPILSYIDPKSGKDGLFKKWYEMCFKTFLSLFIRLLALYFAVYVISKVADMQLVDVIDGSYVGGWNLLTVFIIIGALMFAKQLPEILKGLGIKLDGDGKFTLNPLRKMENQMLGGKYLKKPNDALAKLGKGIITAPGQALATGGKRLVAGAYSASNGRGFRRGWESVDSPFKKALNKKIDEWAPDFAKDRQEARVARLDAQENLRRDRKMEKIGDKKNFENKLASTDGRYYELYQEAENKKVQKQNIENKANRWIAAINNNTATPDQLNSLYDSFGLEGADRTEDVLIGKLNKQVGIATKAHEYAVQQKETYGKSSASARRAAQLEKDFDFYDKTHSETSIPAYSYFEPSSTDLARDLNSNSSETVKSSMSGAEDTREEIITEEIETLDTGVMDRVNEVTGVSRDSAINNGATTSAIVESVMEEIRKEMERLKQIHDTTTDRDEMIKAAKRLKELEKELEDIRRRNS